MCHEEAADKETDNSHQGRKLKITQAGDGMPGCATARPAGTEADKDAAA